MTYDELVANITARVMVDRMEATEKIRAKYPDLFDRFFVGAQKKAEVDRQEEVLVRARIKRILGYARDAGVPIPTETEHG